MILPNLHSAVRGLVLARPMSAAAAPTRRLLSRTNISHERSIPTGRASIRDLQRRFDGIPSSSSSSSSSSVLPTQLASILDEAAKNEDRSDLSGEAYENVVREMTSFMSSTVTSYGKKFDSGSVYNPEMLSVYDALVWGFNSPFLWRISQEDVSSLYRANVSRRHCEIAVGTGLFLSEIFPSTKEITLLDINENCLRVCEERIKNAYHRTNNEDENVTPPDISKLVVDIMEPSPSPGEDKDHNVKDQSSNLMPIRGKFQSVGVNFLFHCLHGSNLHEKADAFRNCASLLDPEDGVFFGSTILGKEMLDDENNAGETAMSVLRVFNDVGVFGNLGDSLEDLDGILRDIFDDVDVRRVGYCGVWTARHPKV